MKTNFTYLICLVLNFALQSDAQPLKYTVGSYASIYDDQAVGIIGETQQSVLERVLLVDKLKMLSVNQFATAYAVAYYDKISLQRTAVKEYPVLKAAGIVKPEKAYLVNEVLNGDTLILFYQHENKETDKDGLYAWKLNAMTLEPLTPEASLLEEIGSRRSDGNSSFSVTFPSSKFIFVSYTKYSKDENASKISVKKYATSLQLQAETDHSVKGIKYGIGVRTTLYTKDDDLILLIAYSKNKNFSITDPLYFTVVGNSSSSQTEVEVENGYAVNCDIILTKAGRLLAVGNYTQIEELKNEKDIFRAGSYVNELDPFDLDIISTQEDEFTTDQKMNLYPTSNNPNNPNRNRSFQANILSTVDLIQDYENDAVILITASNVKVTTTSSTGSIGSSRTSYKSGSVAVTYVDKDAKIAWQKVLPRAAYISGLSNGVYPTVVQNSGKVYVIFNDVDKNVDAFKETLKGKTKSKNRKEESSAVERFEMEGDPTVEVYVWNLSNTLYRITELDALGTMVVTFIDPEKINPEKKAPVLDTRLIERISEGNYILSCFEKSMLGPKNHALMRITF